MNRHTFNTEGAQIKNSFTTLMDKTKISGHDYRLEDVLLRKRENNITKRICAAELKPVG